MSKKRQAIKTATPDNHLNSTYVLEKKLVVWCLLQKHFILPRDYCQLLQKQLAEKIVIQVSNFIFFLDRGRKDITLYKGI